MSQRHRVLPPGTVGKFGNTRPVWGTYKSGGTCALGVGTIVDFRLHVLHGSARRHCTSAPAKALAARACSPSRDHDAVIVAEDAVLRVRRHWKSPTGKPRWLAMVCAWPLTHRNAAARCLLLRRLDWVVAFGIKPSKFHDCCMYGGRGAETSIVPPRGCGTAIRRARR